MVRIKHVGIAFGVVIGLVVVITHLSSSEERAVKRQFHLLSKWVSKDAEETTFAMARKTQNLGRLFAENCRFEAKAIPLSGYYPPEEISRYAAQARLQFSRLSLRFYDLDIRLLEGGRGRVVATARARGLMRTGEVLDETHEVEFLLEKRDKKWFFTHCEVVEVLEK
jgi:hypothetical protein